MVDGERSGGVVVFALPAVGDDVFIERRRLLHGRRVESGVGPTNFKIGLGFGSGIAGVDGANFEIGTPDPGCFEGRGDREWLIFVGLPGRLLRPWLVGLLLLSLLLALEFLRRGTAFLPMSHQVANDWLAKLAKMRELDINSKCL